MKFSNALILGVFASFTAAWCAVVWVPQMQLGGLQPQVDEENADVYPIDIGGLARRGHEVYIANGCAACHTQQIREARISPDIQREWGTRRTVARDYIYDEAITLGSVRNGPDLASVGTAKADDSKRKYVNDPQWQYRHLYNARAVVDGSIMPPFKFLFKKQKITGERAADALDLTGIETPEAGTEVVPTAEAKALVAYLLSLDKSHPLKEIKGAAAAPAAPAAK